VADEAGNNYYTILDSGSPHITVPKTMYNAIIDKLMEASGRPQYYTKDGITFVDCYMVSTYADLSIMMNGLWLDVSPYDYIWDVNNDGETCILMVTEHDHDFFVLGLPIFQGYYSHHSLNDSTIAFTPLSGLDKQPLKVGAVPANYLMPRADEDEDTCTILCFERKLIKNLFLGVFKLPVWLVQFTVGVVSFLVEMLVFLVKLPFLAVYYFFYFFYWVFVLH